MDNLFMWRDRALYVGKILDFSLHKHHAVQISVGINGPFEISFGEDDIYLARTVLIAANVPHQLNTLNNKIANIFLEPESIDCETMLNVNSNKRLYRVWDEIDKEILSKYFLDSNTDEAGASRFLTEALKMVDLDPIYNLVTDERIRRALNRLDESNGAQCTSKELEAITCLSRSRLQHLFKEQVGIPIRRYSLWVRIRYVFELLIDGVKMVDAAIEAGFSDSAHFSCKFKEMFGAPPSAFMSSKRQVNIRLFERFLREK